MASIPWHIQNFFSLLWNVHLRHRCPKCKRKLVETDFPKEMIQRAKCSSKECGWGWNK